MGWREAVEAAVEIALLANNQPPPRYADPPYLIVDALADMPAPDRIALARELLHGTGHTVVEPATLCDRWRDYRARGPMARVRAVEREEG